ncbi:siderophore-iron reductase FhuF [Salinisphaera aquimarina]|uniref:Siderophore-iron reductase FhuF n=1 Tax=Salinisphaera aquimarina TaxID=2094031 RepID=A0ABV7EN05_9GAMM
MFAGHFHDNLAGFAEVFQTSDDRRDALDGARLADPIHLTPLLARFGRHHGCSEPRATASQWSKYFFSRLGITTLVVQMATDRALDLRLDNLRMTCHEDGTPACFLLASGAQGQASSSGSDFSHLIDHALTPIVAALSLYCRLSARVFWSNAGVYFAWALDELETQQRIPASRLASARALLTRRQRQDGGFNPFYRVYKDCSPGTLDGNDDVVDHCRRLCCMRDLDAQWGLCANCPRAMHTATPDRATG